MQGILSSEEYESLTVRNHVKRADKRNNELMCNIGDPVLFEILKILTA